MMKERGGDGWKRLSVEKVEKKFVEKFKGDRGRVGKIDLCLCALSTYRSSLDRA